MSDSLQDGVEHVKAWYSNFLNNYRGSIDSLLEAKIRRIRGADDYLSPTEIDVFWLKEPEMQLIVKSNFEDSKDSINIHGPFHARDFLTHVEPILKEPRWSRLLPAGETCGERTAKHLRSLMNKAQRMFFLQNNKSGGGISTFNFGDYFSISSVSGKISNNDSELLVKSALRNISNAFDSLNQRPPSEVAKGLNVNTSAITEKSVAYGAYFFPTIIIGEIPQKTLTDILFGRNPLLLTTNEEAFATDFGGTPVFVNKDGFVFVLTNEKWKALKILNTIMGVAIFANHHFLSVKEADLIEIHYDDSVMTATHGGDSIRTL